MKAKISLLTISNAIILVRVVLIRKIAVLYRVDHDILFEEWKSMDKLNNPSAIIFEKDCNKKPSFIKINRKLLGIPLKCS
jgi:hypothetical protein